MKLKGHKIGNKIYFISEAKEKEFGSVEAAAIAAKAKEDARNEPIEATEPKHKKAKKADEVVIPTEAESQTEVTE